MLAMVLHETGQPLQLEERADPNPDAAEILVRVEACAVCRTDLHVIDGELPDIELPRIPGHEIVGRVAALGFGVTGPVIGTRVGIPWLGHTCGSCGYCMSGRENLCDAPRFTGYTCDGGFATHVVAEAAYVLDLSAFSDPVATAPLLCAGLIGWRCVKAAGNGRAIGLYGFGAAAHIVAQICAAQGRDVYAFTRPGDDAAQNFARRLGATWAGDSDRLPPARLDAAIIFAPDGRLVPMALRATKKGGRVVCGGIHMSDIPQFPYRDLWCERAIISIANLTRDDAHSFLALARQHPIQTTTTTFDLRKANTAIALLRAGQLRGAAVLVP